MPATKKGQRRGKDWFEDGEYCALTHQDGPVLVRVCSLTHHGVRHGEEVTLYEVEEVVLRIRYTASEKDLRRVKGHAERDAIMAENKAMKRTLHPNYLGGR